MRRILVGSILLSWIAFLVSVTVRGVGGAEHGLLAEMQLLLTVSPAFSLSFGFARALLTGVVPGPSCAGPFWLAFKYEMEILDQNVNT